MRENVVSYKYDYDADITDGVFISKPKIIFLTVLFVIMMILLLFFYISDGSWFFYVGTLAVSFIIFLISLNSGGEKRLYLTPHYLLCGDEIIYYRNITFFDENKNLGTLVIHTPNTELTIHKIKFPTNARKDFKIEKNKTAKFLKVAQKITTRVHYLNPNLVNNSSGNTPVPVAQTNHHFHNNANNTHNNANNHLNAHNIAHNNVSDNNNPFLQTASTANNHHTSTQGNHHHQMQGQNNNQAQQPNPFASPSSHGNPSNTSSNNAQNNSLSNSSSNFQKTPKSANIDFSNLPSEASQVRIPDTPSNHNTPNNNNTNSHQENSHSNSSHSNNSNTGLDSGFDFGISSPTTMPTQNDQIQDNSLNLNPNQANNDNLTNQNTTNNGQFDFSAFDDLIKK